MVLSRVNNVKSGWKSMFMAAMEIYLLYRTRISAKYVCVLFEALRAVVSHAHKINCDAIFVQGSRNSPLLRLENESYQTCLTLLQNLILDRPSDFNEKEIESYLVNLCREVLQFYIQASSGQTIEPSTGFGSHWKIPLGSRRRRELAGRAPLIVATLQAICNMAEASFQP